MASVPFASPARKQADPKDARACSVRNNCCRYRSSCAAIDSEGNAYQDLRRRASRAHRVLSAREPHPDRACGGMSGTMAGVKKTSQRVPTQLARPGRCLRARLLDPGQLQGRWKLPSQARQIERRWRRNPRWRKRRCDRRLGYSVWSALLRVTELSSPSHRGLVVARKTVRRPVSCVACFQDSASVAEGCDASARLHAHPVPPRR